VYLPLLITGRNQVDLKKTGHHLSDWANPTDQAVLFRKKENLPGCYFAAFFVVFLAAGFFAVVFFTEVFFAAGFLAAGFLAAGFLGVAFLAVVFFFAVAIDSSMILLN
jgi:hypothetical protein